MGEWIPDGARELRATMTDASMTEASNGTFTFEGYPAVYGRDSEPMAVRAGGQIRKFVEHNEAGGFGRILATQPDIRLLGLNHDENHVLARTKSGTLEATHDERGLKFRAPDLAPTTYVVELRSMIERRDVDAMSYGFTANPAGERWDHSDPMLSRRFLSDYKRIWDGAPVTFPAFKDTEAHFRQLEAELRSGVLSRRELRQLLDDLEPRGGPQAPAGEPTERRAQQCPGCGGTGDCSSCAGTGKAGRTMRAARATQMNCDACYGSGTCQGCRGQGVTPNADPPSPVGETDYRRSAAVRERRRRLRVLAPDLTSAASCGHDRPGSGEGGTR